MPPVQLPIFFHGLTPAQHERYATLSEEAGEVVQAIGKILRHGPESHNPKRRTGYNKADLERELGDLWAIVQYMIDQEDLSGFAIQQALVKKRRKLEGKVNNYFHHQQIEDA